MVESQHVPAISPSNFNAIVEIADLLILKGELIIKVFPVERTTRDRKIAAYCQVGQRGHLTTRILPRSGSSAAILAGGYRTDSFSRLQELPSKTKYGGE